MSSHCFASHAACKFVASLASALLVATAHAQVVPRGTPGRGAVATGKDRYTTLIVVGDSLSHGTMDGTNNSPNTLHAYVQLTADSLDDGTLLNFSQPLFDESQQRLMPFRIPTNLGVDGADAFTVEGLDYYKRAGTPGTLINDAFLCDETLPRQLDTKYDRVMYPINLRTRGPVSQMDAAEWLMEHYAPAGGTDRAVVVLWIGNNDASNAALGGGGENPAYLPLPTDEIMPEINADLRLLLRVAESRGIFSNDTYTQAKIERFLTEPSDFYDQFQRLLERLIVHPSFAAGNVDLFVLTLPYYSAVGYLFDSDDIEFYLRKLDPAYTVPPTFARVAEPGKPITDPLRGDRISILTFGFMYTLLHSGYSVEYVNGILERDGVQRDDLVLSQAEQQFIMARIDSFNDSIRALTAIRLAGIHRVDIGDFLNAGLSGEVDIMVGDRALSRKWTRGSGFCLDGVHPGYTGQAIVANYLLSRINQVLGVAAPLHDLEQILNTDPYVDHDGDGWAPGPGYPAAGLTELLFLLTDPNDADANVQVRLPRNVWDLLSEAMLEEVLGIPSVRREAEALGNHR